MSKILFKLIKGCKTCPYHDDNADGLYCHLIKITMPKSIGDTFISPHCGLDEETEQQLKEDDDNEKSTSSEN